MKFSRYAYVVLPHWLTIMQVDFQESSISEILQFDDIMEPGTIYSMLAVPENFQERISILSFLNMISNASMILVSDSLLKDICEVTSYTFDEAVNSLKSTDLVEQISLDKLIKMLNE